MTLTRTSDQPRERRKRKCAVCRTLFEPRSLSHKACKSECAQIVAQATRQKDERKADRAKRQALKTKGAWLKEAQVAFNAYIRERDRLAGHSCICCGSPLDWTGNNVDAGHYRSRGSAPHLRFDERNVHAQTKKCNRYGAGRAVDYRLGLIARAGLEAVEELEADNAPKNYTIADLQGIIATYKAKLRELKARG